MKNAFSIDLEDWFCVRNLSSQISFSDWDGCDLRVVENTDRLLGLLDRHDVKCTFFVLGWIAEKCPDLVGRIGDAGHEIGTHGYAHLMANRHSPEDFEKDLAASLRVIESCTDCEVVGYRAPSFSVDRGDLWIFRILAKHGIRYDSSVFPISFHPDYGSSDSPLGIHSVTDSVEEFPLSCFRLFGVNVPCCGGAYFRFFPYALTAAGIRRCNREGRPVVFYLHPWEIDAEQPRVAVSGLKAFRHYFNLRKTERRLERLLTEFEFGTISSVLKLWSVADATKC